MALVAIQGNRSFQSWPARPLDAALLEGLAEPVAVKEKSQ
jgi:hypothetical protein